jgi:hypothetical protein
VARSQRLAVARGRGAARHRRAAPDIVHAHYISSYGYLAARCGRQPLVMTAWGSDLLVTPRQRADQRWLTAWTLRRATPGHWRLARPAGRGPRLPAVACAARADSLGRGARRFAPVPWADKPGFEAGEPAQSWEPTTASTLILRAFAQLRRPARACTCWAVAATRPPAQLVAELALQNSCNFMAGWMTPAWRRAGALQAVLSVPASDATSVSVLESMACGLAVMASDLPANREWLPAEALVPVDDLPALARLAGCSRRRGLAERLGAQTTPNACGARAGDRRVQMDRAWTRSTCAC